MTPTVPEPAGGAVTIRAALSSWQDLATISDTPELECQILLAELLHVPRARLFSHGDESLSAAQWQDFQLQIARRRAGEPIAYITGHAGFWDMDLQVTGATLIPRPETELLIEAILAERPATLQTLADLGTGTGAIAIAIARERPDWRVYATDMSPDALAVSRRNTRAWTNDAIQLVQADWLDAFAPQAFDVIVCNPPYIDSTDDHLDALRYEPRSALVAKDHGMADLHAVIRAARDALTPGGQVFVEHGHDQQSAVVAAMTAAGLTAISPRLDLNQQPRYVFATKPATHPGSPVHE